MQENYSMGNPLLECPNEFAKRHVFFNLKTGQILPSRCKTWKCPPCARMNLIKISYLAKAGRAERFVTLTRAGTSPKQINFNLKHLIQGLRRDGYRFEYLAVPELHQNGEPHIHLLQRGDFIPQDLLSKKWNISTSGSYNGSGSHIVDIRMLKNPSHAKRYLCKYLLKSFDDNGPKSWQKLQELYPGLNHYRYSRAWLPARAVEKDWLLVPSNTVDLMTRQESNLLRQGKKYRRLLIA